MYAHCSARMQFCICAGNLYFMYYMPAVVATTTLACVTGKLGILQVYIWMMAY